MKRQLLFTIIFALVLGPLGLKAQAQKSNSDLDSLYYYRKVYNKRIEALMQDKLGETLEAISKMNIQDTSVFDADSLQRFIARGQKIIDQDPQASYLDKKYKYFLAKIKEKEKGLKD